MAIFQTVMVADAAACCVSGPEVLVPVPVVGEGLGSEALTPTASIWWYGEDLVLRIP